MLGSLWVPKLKSVLQSSFAFTLAADKDSLPECLDVIATADDGEIMAVSHREYEIYGLQFHPESIMTPVGQKILRNFLTITDK